jgi:hypothetical protein
VIHLLPLILNSFLAGGQFGYFLNHPHLRGKVTKQENLANIKYGIVVYTSQQ